MNILRVTYEDEAEKVRKLRGILARLGYTSTLANPIRMTVGELAKMLHRNVSNVSTQLRSRHCPPYVSAKGKRRLLWIEPNDALISYLTHNTQGQRNDRRHDRQKESICQS